MSVSQRFGRLQRIAAGADGDAGADDDVRRDVHAGSQLGPARDEEMLVASPGAEIEGGVSDFKARAVAGQLRPVGDQPAALGTGEDVIQESIKGLFFKRRVSALQSVEYVGTTVRPKTARRSDQSRSS